MKLEPTYVDFDTAKLLKKKGAELNTHYCFLNNSSLWYHIHSKSKEDKLALYTWSYFNSFDNMLYAPERGQVIEWLRVTHGIHITHEWDYSYSSEKEYYFYKIKFKDKEGYVKALTGESVNSPQEAYSAAFDYVLKNLI